MDKLAFPKDKRIKDSKLMKKIHKENEFMRCDACSKIVKDYDIHHIIRRANSKGHDTEDNFAYLCHKDHMILHSSPDQFKRLYGEDKYKFMTGKT